MKAQLTYKVSQYCEEVNNLLKKRTIYNNIFDTIINAARKGEWKVSCYQDLSSEVQEELESLGYGIDKSKNPTTIYWGHWY